MIGAGFAATGLANIAIRDVEVGLSFTAQQSGKIIGFRSYMIDRAPGYGDGTGGVISVRCEPHSYPGYLSEGEAIIDQQLANETPWHEYHQFSKPIEVLLGERYRLVFSNQDPEPRDNYISVNSLYTARGPRCADEWLEYRVPGKEWVRRPYLPVYALTFMDGNVQSQGYIHSMLHEVGEYQHLKQIHRTGNVRQRFAIDESGWLGFNVSARGFGRLGGTIFVNGNEVGTATSDEWTMPDRRGFSIYTLWFDTVPEGEAEVILWCADGEFEVGMHRPGAEYGFPDPDSRPHGAQYRPDPDEPWRDFEVWGTTGIRTDLMYWITKVGY